MRTLTAIVAFNHFIQSDQRVENVCLTVRDGMMLAWKREYSIRTST